MALRREPDGTDSSSPPQEDEQKPTVVPSRCSRHHHISPIALVTRNRAEIKIRSDQLTYRILLGLLDGRYYAQHPVSRKAEYKQTLPRGRGHVLLVLTPHSHETWEQVLAWLALLGDELVDTFLVLLAVALDSHGTEHITAPFTITADDILTICQKKKSKGSYPVRQRQNILAQIEILSRISVHATLVLRDSRPGQVESPLLEILPNEQAEENQTYPGFSNGYSWYLKIGTWAGMIPELQSQTVLMARQVLHYHARQQKYEKRLGRYLTVLYRINVHRHEGRVKISMGVLLEQAGIVLDRDNPGRTRDMVERALNQLHHDGVIGRFVPLIEPSSGGQESHERIEQHAYHWWDDYRRQLWLFDPPQRYEIKHRSHLKESEGPD